MGLRLKWCCGGARGADALRCSLCVVAWSLWLAGWLRSVVALLFRRCWLALPPLPVLLPLPLSSLLPLLPPPPLLLLLPLSLPPLLSVARLVWCC